MMPNMIPRRPRPRASVFYNTGHGHLGWTLSATMAEIVTNNVTQRG
jgi:D-amino-acid dehydrogenase